MELSAELYEKTIRGIKGDLGASGQERRISPRVGLRCRVQIIPVVNGVAGKPQDVWTRDISPGGIGVMCSARMKLGTRFVIRLPREDGESHMAIICTIKNCSELANGIFAIGAAFDAVDGTLTPREPSHRDSSHRESAQRESQRESPEKVAG